MKSSGEMVLQAHRISFSTFGGRELSIILVVLQGSFFFLPPELSIQKVRTARLLAGQLHGWMYKGGGASGLC